MTRKLLVVLTLSVVALSLALGGSGKKDHRTQDMQTQIDQMIGQEIPFTPTPDGRSSFARPLVGNYTTLSGFYDWQSNGGAVQHVQVNPANGNIHVTYMLAEDSTALPTSRRSGYAFSTNGGQSWNNFSNVRVPARSSGYPCLTLLKGANAGLPTIANHSTITGTQSTIFIDSPEGGGAFSEINAPPLIAGTNQPIWPNIAGALDGSVVMAASPNTTPEQNYWTRTSDLATWSSWIQFPDTNSRGGRYPTYANDNGRVGTFHNAGNAGGAWWMVSTNNGSSWGAAQNIYPIWPPGRITAIDTFRMWVGADFVWDGNTPLMTMGEQSLTTGHNNRGQILFWSQATGMVLVADSANTPGSIWPLNKAQSNHLTIGWPVMAKSGSILAIVYQAFTADTNAEGWNYSDIYFTQSGTNGATWTRPIKITNTSNLDERYPSISKWNEAGKINITWQEDITPGSSAFTDLSDTTRSRQVFYKMTLPPILDVDQDEITTTTFRLRQNYPNPFNPATKIDYTVAHAGPVSIRVYNTLGQEVATLLNEVLSPGNYQVTFDGANLPSGVYFYKMTAGSYVESRKMILMK